MWIVVCGVVWEMYVGASDSGCCLGYVLSLCCMVSALVQDKGKRLEIII